MVFNKGDLVFVAFIDDENKNISGFFNLVTLNESYVIIRTTQGNEIFLPISKILKIKKNNDGDTHAKQK